MGARDELAAFREELLKRLPSPYARPFVCDGSPLTCQAFIVGENAATRLEQPFVTYWSDESGFLLDRFQRDYLATRDSIKGARPRIERISGAIAPCLETNVYATPTPKARNLTAADRKHPIIEFLFEAVKPRLVFAHGKTAVDFFAQATGAQNFTEDVQRSRWHGHDFLLYGRPGPLWRMGFDEATALGTRLSQALDQNEQA